MLISREPNIGLSNGFLQALLVEQSLKVCWFCVSEFVSEFVWDNFSASDWSKIGVDEVDELDEGDKSAAAGKQDK